MDATDAIKTATNVTAAIDVSIISVLRRLPDLMDDAFLRNVGFGRFMEYISEESLDHAVAVDVDIESCRMLAKARHRHDGSGQYYEIAGTGRKPYVTDCEGESGRIAQCLLVVG